MKGQSKAHSQAVIVRITLTVDKKACDQCCSPAQPPKVSLWNAGLCPAGPDHRAVLPAQGSQQRPCLSGLQHPIKLTYPLIDIIQVETS